MYVRPPTLHTTPHLANQDPGFLGLIVAVFQDDAKQQLGRMELTAFQSVPPGGSGDGLVEMVDVAGMEGGGEWEKDEFCMALDKSPAAAAATAKRAVLVDDEEVLFEDDGVGAACEHDDAAAAAVSMAMAYETAGGSGGGGGGGGAYARKGVPIRLVSAAALASASMSSAEPLTPTATVDAARCVVSLQEVLLAEERFFYESAARTNARNNGNGDNDGHGGGDVHALYNAAVYAKALAALMEESGLPLLNSLEAALLNLRRDGKRLAAANARLRARLGQGEKGKEAAAAEAAVPMEMEGGGGAGGGGGPSATTTTATTTNSRAAWLREAKRGVLMQAAEGVALEGLLRVSMDRDYGPDAEAGSRLGVWQLRVAPEGEAAALAGGGGGGGGIEGRIVGIAPAAHTYGPGAVCFTLAAGGQPEEQRRLVLVGEEAAAALWLNGVGPLVCPEIV